MKSHMWLQFDSMASAGILFPDKVSFILSIWVCHLLVEGGRNDIQSVILLHSETHITYSKQASIVSPAMIILVWVQPLRFILLT